MDETVKLLYRIFLQSVKGCKAYQVTSCKLNGNAVEIGIRLWKGAKPYKVVLKPAERETDWT